MLMEILIVFYLNMNFVSDVSPEIQKIENLFSNMKNLFPWFIKGIVHPEMKILSLITHPHVVPNP